MVCEGVFLSTAGVRTTSVVYEVAAGGRAKGRKEKIFPISEEKSHAKFL